MNCTYYSYFICVLIVQDKYKDLHPRLPVIVAETLLYADPEIELPLWLVQMFKVTSVVYLLIRSTLLFD
jgi:hypothetical protein